METKTLQERFMISEEKHKRYLDNLQSRQTRKEFRDSLNSHRYSLIGAMVDRAIDYLFSQVKDTAQPQQPKGA